MTLTDTLITIALFAVLALLISWHSSNAQISRNQVSGKVRHIVDGDTLYIEGVKPAIRLWGIDTPEQGEPGFATAARALDQLAMAKQITCEKMDTDRYGRIVGRCILEDGSDIGRVMIDGGHAREFCRYSKGFYGRC